MDKDNYQLLITEIAEELEQPNSFNSFGFLRNPFPKAGEILVEPFYNQEKVNEAFLEGRFKPFIKSNGRESDWLLVYGDHRVGKTNFLLHWKHLITRLIADGILVGYSCVYHSVYSGKFIEDIHKPLVIELSKVVFPSFFETFDSSALDGRDDDLARAINRTAKRTTRKLFNDFNDPGVSLFVKWFSGEKCASSELKELGVLSNIDTTSLAIKYFRDFLVLAQKRDVFKGLIFFLDEFELAFSTVTATYRARFLQDIRHFIDMLQEGILMVVASLAGVQTTFYRDYPAVRGRFGDAQELREIQSADEAKEYVKAYIEHGHKAYKEAGGKGRPRLLVNEQEIENVFNEVLEEHQRVTQGWFFAKLHDRVQQKISKQKAA